MAEFIQQILTLPRPQQIEIIQAIMAQWQIQEGDPGQEEILIKQLGYVEAVSRDVKEGKMPTVSFEAYKKRVELRRQKRKGA